MFVTAQAEAQLQQRAAHRVDDARTRASAAEARVEAANVRATEPRSRLVDADLALDDALAANLASSDRAARVREALPGAGARAELSLAYQPLCRLDDDQLIGFEALLRWTSPTLGHISPDEFIPVAEETGGIVAIGDWVVQRALTTLASWRARLPAQDLTMAVNVAPEQLVQPAFIDRLCELLTTTGVPPSALTLEITERTLISDEPALRNAMLRLRATGVRLSVDDFGTGFSSLGRLASFPLDELKIDRIFVAGLGEDRRQRALVAGIIGMSTALELSVVAEGIETHAQHDILLQLGCELGQGYLLGRPVNTAGLSRLMDPPSASAPQ